MLNFVWRDALMTIVLRLVLVIVFMLPLLAEQKKADDGDEPPGNVIATISWPPGNDDVDLWLMGPGEAKPVGYSNKGGRLWNLLRDDLGNVNDGTVLNYENAFARGAPTGEYIINLHCYRCSVFPLKVTIEIRSSALTQGKGTAVLFTSSTELRAAGQERTAVRFRLDGNAGLVKDSVDFTFKPLRAATGTRFGS